MGVQFVGYEDHVAYRRQVGVCGGMPVNAFQHGWVGNSAFLAKPCGTDRTVQEYWYAPLQTADRQTQTFGFFNEAWAWYMASYIMSCGRQFR